MDQQEAYDTIEEVSKNWDRERCRKEFLGLLWEAMDAHESESYELWTDEYLKNTITE